MKQRTHFFIDPSEQAALHVAGLDTAEAMFAWTKGVPLSKANLAPHRRRWRIDITGEAGDRVYYLKQILKPGLVEQIRRIWSGSRRHATAERERYFIDRLSTLHVPTIRCVALALQMTGWWERRSALLTEQVQGESLERWLPREWERTPRRRRTALIRQVAAAARKMHEAGLYHRDLYLSHLFVEWKTPDEPIVRVIDLARMIERPFLEQRWRIKDLAALHHSAPVDRVSRSDRLRFLRGYAPHLDHPKQRRSRHAKFRDWIARIEARTARMRRHDLKHGRTWPTSDETGRPAPSEATP
jgi:heptose I phosphotransferase